MPQQPRYVQLPNGTYLEWPENVTADQFKAKALKVMGQSVRGPSSPPKSEAEVSSFKMATGHDPKSVTSWFDPKESWYAAKEMGKGAVVDTAKGIWSLIHPPSMEELIKAQGSPIDVVGRRMGSYLSELGKEALQVPGAIKDLAKNKEGYALPALELQAPRAIGQAVGALLTEKAGERFMGKPQASSAETARSLTDAINPPPEQMARFQEALSQHLDKVVTFAAKKGIKLDSLENVSRAMKEASTAIRTHYYEQILGPFKDSPVDITSVKGYSGENAGTPSSATLGQLDARLSQINAEMFPKYNKAGEAAARAAVKSDAELNAEASSIRNVLYPKLGSATGISPEVIAQTRSAFGSLDDLAGKTSKSAMQARSAANKAAQEPITLNPLSNTKAFVADKALNKVRGNPVENAIKRAINTSRVRPYELPKPHPAAMAKAPRSAPIRGGSRPIGKVSTPTEAEVAELSNRFKEREAKVLASRNKTLRRPLWEKQHPPQGSVGP